MLLEKLKIAQINDPYELKMSTEDSPESRQKFELEALKAIYGEDLRDLRTKGAWGKWKPLDLSISLIPTQGNSGEHSIYAKVDLRAKCPHNYPNGLPTISLENPQGLSHNNLTELKDLLDKKAVELKGQEMIFELCQLVREFLHKNNKPATKSFYDEMLQRQREKELKAKEEQKLERDRERQFMFEEIQKRQEILKSESRLWKENRKNSDNCDKSSNGDSFSELSAESLCDHKESVIMQICDKEIQRGQCLRHCETHILFSGIDRGTGEILLISEWLVKDASQVLRQIHSIEQELNYLTKLKHKNLSPYFGINYQSDINGNIKVYVLKEFIFGTSCSTLFNEHFTMDVQFIKYISKGVLGALDYLHRNNVVHKDLKKSCVFIDDKGNVIVSSYSIYKRLSDLICQNQGSCYSKKTDIYKFGLFLISLVQEGPIIDEENVNIPQSVAPDFYDFLTKCLTKEEKERFTAVQLLNHSFISKPVIKYSLKKITDIPMPERQQSPDNVPNDLLFPLSPSHSGSRIKNEFEFLQNLGKGAFGDVIKVRNKLDGRYYAIKRIQLNPKNRQLNKKIVREVKLLSRLNHENVVRYYNSWIETTIIECDELDSATNTTSSESNVKHPRLIKYDEFTINDNIEELAPSIKNIEVSITYDSKSQQPAFNLSSSDEDSSDDEDGWGVFNGIGDSDTDSIEFEKDVDATSSLSTKVDESSQENLTPIKENTKQIDFMYIQMEFCEKSTLRTAIDNNLFKDEDRVWRLFREIVEGLAHIHQQGMIHRDLKPVNIFLDYDDHVKIGDFGLATTNIASKFNEYSQQNKSLLENEEHSMDESKTGFIGTALYVAPELSLASKAIYNQKVDIYSLGIILFEMCYKSLGTTMERIKILTGIRKKEINLPDDFIEKKNDKQIFLIKWLLNHDISKRPTSQELLQSEYIPPPVLEERELRELVRHTLSNPQLKGYKYLIASCFNQSFTPAQDLTYDKDPSGINSIKPLQLYELVKDVIVKVFKNHGGQNLATPLLMPKSRYYENVESYVKLMTHFGGVVSLPHDLHVPFARYTAWNGITNLRRYSIERVYREKRVFGFLPRELYECAFDIVTPSPALIQDAEILYLTYEVFNELPGIKNKNFTIRLNHTLLLKAILLHFGIKEKHNEVFQIVANIKEGRTPKIQVQNLAGLGLSDNTIMALLNMFNFEAEISKALSHFQAITKKKSSEASQLAKQALVDIKTIAQNAEAFGVTFDIVVSPGTIFNIDQYSGTICQFVCELKKKHKQGAIEVLAAGGRYDSMISSYRNIMEHANMLGKDDIKQSAVGISISLDKLVHAIQKEYSKDLPKLNVLDAVVCSLGKKSLLKEKTNILRELWSVGIKCCLIESSNVEDVQEQCAELNVPHVIMLKDSEPGTVRVMSGDRDRFQEKTFKTNEVVENMQRIIRTWNDAQQETTLMCSRSDSKSERNEQQESNVLIYFKIIDKISPNGRKRHEMQITNQLDHVFKRLNGEIIVLVLSFESNVIRTLSSHLEFNNDQEFQKSVNGVIERHQRYKKYLIEVCDEIYEHKNKKSKPIVILYSLNDSFYKLIF